MKSIVRLFYGLGFTLIWLGIIASLVLTSYLFINGATKPNQLQTVPFTMRDDTVYISPAQSVLKDTCWTVVLTAIPCWGGLGLILHFGLGVKIFGRSVLGRH